MNKTANAIPWTTFKTIFETVLALGTCHVTIIEGVVYKKSMIFEFSCEYLSEYVTFLCKIFLVARSYLVVVINIKTLTMGALVTLETRLKLPILAVF